MVEARRRRRQTKYIPRVPLTCRCVKQVRAIVTWISTATTLPHTYLLQHLPNTLMDKAPRSTCQATKCIGCIRRKYWQTNQFAYHALLESSLPFIHERILIKTGSIKLPLVGFSQFTNVALRHIQVSLLTIHRHKPTLPNLRSNQTIERPLFSSPLSPKS